jgi:ABC-type Fe3+ transport system substrate-binding protein
LIARCRDGTDIEAGAQGFRGRTDFNDGSEDRSTGIGLTLDLGKHLLRQSKRRSSPTKKFVPQAAIGNKAVGFGLAAIGLAYNTEIFERNGWPAPASWNDLGKEEFRNAVGLATIGNGYGLSVLIMLAKANGGSESNIEPGFEAMKKVAPNVLTFMRASR